MTTAIATYLKFANIQIAAEALYGKKTAPVDATYEGALTVDNLTTGNERTSVFTLTQAKEFSLDWEVVEHKSNTSTGFSGTLLRALRTDEARGVAADELVMSFRSTEFADDAVRDNQATNALEIKEKGWAFGQIADMEAWYASLKQSGKLDPGAAIAVTGYSLGGHLAAAFNLLHKGDTTSFGAPLIKETYTFNGAGVGQINAGHTLRDVIDAFSQYRNAPALVNLGDAQLNDIYMSIRSRMDGRRMPAETDFSQVQALIVQYGDAARPILEALQRVDKVMREQERVSGIRNGSTGPLDVPLDRIEAATMDYQMAVVLASMNTSSYHTAPIQAGWDAFRDVRTPAPAPGLSNVFDIYGATYPSAVSNSQLHYGEPIRVAIENQPLLRGNVVWNSLVQSLLYADVKLLTDNFSQNDFGDTHSLVLIVDSLSVQNAFAQLDNTFTLGKAQSLMNVATNAKAETSTFSQGHAEGDALEKLLTALAAQLGIGIPELKPSLDGNTWFEVQDKNGSTGRATFHAALNKVVSSEIYGSLLGKTSIQLVDANLSHQAKARVGFEEIAALQTLSPFVMSGVGEAGKAALDGLWLGSTWGESYTDWLQDRSLSTLGKAPAAFTDQWIDDRAAMLQALISANTRNADANPDGYLAVQGSLNESVNTRYIDLPTGNLLQVNNTRIDPNTASNENKYVIFGGKSDNTLNGGSEADHLYGGGGIDTLNGKAGIDYLEGNAGDDVLDGGQGNDTLAGGAGNDTYQFTGAFGSDTIVDSDGTGIIQVDGNPLQGGKKVEGLDKVWRNEEQGYTFTLAGSGADRSLLIMKDNGLDAIRVKNWQDGQLGLAMDSAASPPLVVQHIYNGDQHAPLAGDGYDWLSTHWGADGTLIGGVEEADFFDVIHGSYAGDEISGLGGKDVLQGWLGDDEIDGGEGDDLIAGGPGRDLIHGGAGNDVIMGAGNFYALDYNPYSYASVQAWDPVLGTSVLGQVQFDPVGTNEWINGTLTWIDLTSPDPDVIVAGDGDDLVFGSGYDDVVAGDGGSDLLWGMEGNDIMVGGAGGDVLVGDVDGVDYALLQTQGSDVPPVIYGKDFLDGGDGDDILLGGGAGDALYGGAGNDVLAGDGSSGLLLDGSYANHLVSSVQQGDDFLDGGDGDDTLTGAGGDDILMGGAGADMLDGGSGNDSFSAGAGDTVTDSEGVDVLMLADGAPVSVTAGGADLLLGYGNRGTLRIVDALRGSIEFIDGAPIEDWLKNNLREAVHVASSGENQSLSGGAGDDTLESGHAHVSLAGGTGNDTYVIGNAGVTVIEQDDEGADTVRSNASFSLPENVENLTLTGAAANGTGNTSDNVIMGNAAANLLAGGFGNDALDGGSGDDTVYGEGGDDVLYSSRGRDTLAGGDGLDTYVLNYGADRNIAVDDSAEGSIIKLGAPGMKFDDLSAARRGDDLVVEVRGTAASMLIKDYYAAAQTSWVFEDAQGNTTTGDALVEASRTDWTQLQAKLLKDFQSGAVGSISRSYADSGYVQQGDGSWYRAASYTMGMAKTYEVRTEFSKSVHTPFNDPGHPWSTASSYVSYADWATQQWGQETASDRIATVSFDTRVLESGTETIQSYHDATTHETAWSAVHWTGDGGTHSESGWVYESSMDWPAAHPTEFINFYTRYNLDSDYYEGAVGPLSFQDPGASALAGELPDYVAVDFLHRRDSYQLGSSILADGDQTVWADPYSAVIGGTGNNIIFDAGFAYGGTGNAQLIGGGTLMAGIGDQYLERGDLMVVGDGHDTVVGHSDSRILVNPANLGIDLIGEDFDWESDMDFRGQSYAVKAIYQAMGYANWEKNYQYGGKYRLDFGEDFQGYFDSMEDARAAFVPSDAWPSFDLAMADALTTWRYVEPLTVLYKTPYTSVEDPESDLVASSYYAAHGITGTMLAADDFAALQPLLDAGLLPGAVVSFGPGLALADLSVSWSEAAAPLDGTPHAALDILWGADQGLRILMPRSGDALDSVVQRFEFADGTVSSLLDLMARADIKMVGTADADTLAGTAGIDRLEGMAGDDEYTVNNRGDVVVERKNEGNDTVHSNVDYTLAANVENLTLVGGAALNGTGNSLNNWLVGNDGNNVLVGGFGADTLLGGEGDDVIDGLAPAADAAATAYVTSAAAGKYVVDDGAAMVFALSDGAVPAVSPGQSLKVVDGGNSVQVYVTPGSKLDGSELMANETGIHLSGKLSDYGQAIDQDTGVYTFTRTAGLGPGQSESALVTVSDADTRLYFADGVIGLNGIADARLVDMDTFVFHPIQQDWLAGGAQAWPASVALMSQGADQLAGGAGNDCYFVDDAGDAVIEKAGEGADTVQACISYTLGANVENLSLIGTAALHGTGNALDNIIIGSAANNVLEGGLGNDVLSGGAGDDIYIFARGYGADTVQENDAAAGNTDVLQIRAGVRADQLWMRQLDNDLEISVIGTSDKVTVQNWYLGNQHHVEQIRADGGKVLLDSQVETLVQAMAVYAPPGMGQTDLSASYAAALAPVMGATWH